MCKTNSPRAKKKTLRGRGNSREFCSGYFWFEKGTFDCHTAFFFFLDHFCCGPRQKLLWRQGGNRAGGRRFPTQGNLQRFLLSRGGRVVVPWCSFGKGGVQTPFSAAPSPFYVFYIYFSQVRCFVGVFNVFRPDDHAKCRPPPQKKESRFPGPIVKVPFIILDILNLFFFL